MATVASTVVEEIPNGYNNENRVVFQAVLGAASASDTVTLTLPTRWIGTGFTLAGVRVEQFTTAAVGARTKTNIAIASYSYVETTGVISIVLGATAVTTNGRIIVDIIPAD